MNNRVWWSLGIITVVVLIVLIVVGVRRNGSADNEGFDTNNSDMTLPPTSPLRQKYNDYKMSAYLNYSSTNATRTGVYNSADMAYPPVIDIRKNYIQACNYIRKYVNAHNHARVIINSGATESIANCIWWARDYNPEGVILGSANDHFAVPMNCENMDMMYLPELTNPVLPDNTSMIYLTHVDGKTGNILNIENYMKNVFNKYSFMNDKNNGGDIKMDKRFTRQIRPIIAVDVTQSITKIPIDMQKWKVNALFFSLHKLGGPMGMGVLVIMDTYEDCFTPPFKPLIAGYQQLGMRGGTWDMEEFVNVHRCIKDNDNKNKRKNKWVEGYEKLQELGLKVVQPDKNHMFNTYLIETEGCPMGIIHTLAREGIYVGNASSCSNEALHDMNREIRKKLYGDEVGVGTASVRNGDSNKIIGGRAMLDKKYIRISFNKESDFTMETLEKIARVVNGASEK